MSDPNHPELEALIAVSRLIEAAERCEADAALRAAEMEQAARQYEATLRTLAEAYQREQTARHNARERALGAAAQIRALHGGA